MSLLDGVVFLPGAAEEFLSLRKANPGTHAGVLAALRELARNGPPEGTCYVPVQEPPFPNTLEPVAQTF